MKMTFRWYGKDDPITLNMIRQIPGVTGIVTAVYDVPVGEAWSEERIFALKREVKASGLALSVIESVPVHEDIKLGCGNRDRYIENYCTTLRNLAKAGVDCVCYNFMPVFDWTRSDLCHPLADGSNALSYDHQTVLSMDPVSGSLSLPGWDESYTKEELRGLLTQYKEIDEETLWKNLKYFLDRVIKVAEEVKVRMAIHPDDPPWSIFGLPRIITNEENLARFLKLYDSPYNGLTLCSGSLGVSRENDIVHMVERFADRIHFAHMRNVKITRDHCFTETGHRSEDGSLDMVRIMKAYHDAGFSGYMRPDHGRMIWGEQGRPGYGLYDRALGAVYLNGIWETLEKEDK